ncbi:MAG: hypothetical protein FD131_3532 [Rhodocyclaceae bacterium]|nr:MAG: hypothetical protein FD131_3532 [Rhodocyclaceae bacterium]
MIESELLIGMALLQWTPRQLSDYASALGYPVSLSAIEDGMGMPWSRFCLSADSLAATNVQEALASLGLGFAHEVFGVTRKFDVRLEPGESCVSGSQFIGALLQNFATYQVTATVQEPVDGGLGRRSIALVITTSFGTKLLYDEAAIKETDAEDILALLYATCLTRLAVVTECIENVHCLRPEDAIERVLAAPALPATGISRARTQQLLSGENS